MFEIVGEPVEFHIFMISKIAYILILACAFSTVVSLLILLCIAATKYSNNCDKIVNSQCFNSLFVKSLPLTVFVALVIVDFKFHNLKQQIAIVKEVPDPVIEQEVLKDKKYIIDIENNDWMNGSFIVTLNEVNINKKD